MRARILLDPAKNSNAAGPLPPRFFPEISPLDPLIFRAYLIAPPFRAFSPFLFPWRMILCIGIGRIRILLDKNPKAGFLSSRMPRPARLQADLPGFAARLAPDFLRRKKDAHTEVKTPQGAV